MMKFKNIQYTDEDYLVVFDKLVNSYKSLTKQERTDALLDELNELFDMLNDKSDISKKYKKKLGTDDLLNTLYNNIIVLKELYANQFIQK